MAIKRHIEINLFPLLRKKPVYCFKKKKWEKYGEIVDPISQKLLGGK